MERMTLEEVRKVLVAAVAANNDKSDADNEPVEYPQVNGSCYDSNTHIADELYEIYYWEDSKQPKGFTVKMEEQWGGEGQGDDYGTVFSVTNNETKVATYIQFNGWYASYEGHSYDGDEGCLVEPRTVEVRQWVRK